MHLNVEHIQRALHDEPLPDDVGLHVATCEACRARVEEAREEEARVFAMLGALDQPVRLPTLQLVQSKAARRRWGGPLRWAAAFVLFASLGGVAYALPGSPVRRWVEAWRKGPEPVNATAPRAEPAPGAVDPSGVSIAAGASVVVTFTEMQSEGEVSIALADVDDIAVEATSGGAQFDVGPAGLTIRNAGLTASYEMRVPRSAAHVEVRIGGVRVWVKDGARIASTPAAGPDGVARIPITR
ncbi:MAG: hypothetical protein H7066_02540 [Cytophagaceae bacterium]|nr:hypothetical protein [Gemmatimonadaceae bacterium]